MTNNNRRTFFIQAIAAGSALASAKAMAQAPARLAETDPQAAALGYKADTKAVDKAKFPKHDPAQACNNCMLYQGKPTDEYAACTLFPGKQVAGAGWCSAWVKKPG